MDPWRLGQARVMIHGGRLAQMGRNEHQELSMSL
jgi:hypothetical protein